MDHLIGLHVTLSADLQRELEVSWEEAMIIAVGVVDGRGAFVHLLGPEGKVTPAIAFEAVTLPGMTQAQLRTWMQQR